MKKKTKRKIKIQKVSSISIVITVIIAILYAVVSVRSGQEFHALKTTTDQYILCETAANELQNASDYLTEQVRLYAMTGEIRYMNQYFEEVNVNRRRENAINDLKKYFFRTDVFNSLEKAMEDSEQLMETEYYSMRLVCEAKGVEQENWPDEIKNVELSEEDFGASDEEKLKKAGNLVSDSEYELVRAEITQDVTECMDGLTALTKKRQERAVSVFSETYRNQELNIGILVVMLIAVCIMVRKLVVRPLVICNECVRKGEIFPIIGAAEIQNLAETYNQVYEENQETQKLIRHQAEHDSMTELLNRGSYEKILNIYEKGDIPFALLLIDVDVFKSVNDTYGHATGDTILKKVADSLKKSFRSIDFVCRIGGDEFAVIMVEMTSDLKYAIEEKITAVEEKLAESEEGVPAVSLSVGIAFSDRENPGESIFKDADKALYYVKEHGRNGYSFYSGDVQNPS